MQHILQIAFDFDDDKVRQIVEKSVENDLDTIIKNLILDKIAPVGSRYGSINHSERDWSNFRNNLDNHIRIFLEEHKEEILDQAAEKLVDSLKRSKAWKEKYEEVLDA